MFSKTTGFWRCLGTPLDAFSHSNEVLIVASMLTVALIPLGLAFSENVGTMSSSLAQIIQMKQEMLHEKVDIISADVVGSKALIMITNYGKYNTTMAAFFTDAGVKLDCTSNHDVGTDMTILPDELLEFTCQLPPDASNVYAVTQTGSVLDAQL